MWCTAKSYYSIALLLLLLDLVVWKNSNVNRHQVAKLNDKQNKIMDQLKDIGPLMNQAMSLIKNVDMEAINNVSSKMSGMINNLQNLKT